jgi:hypothetical protein
MLSAPKRLQTVFAMHWHLCALKWDRQQALILLYGRLLIFFGAPTTLPPMDEGTNIWIE